MQDERFNQFVQMIDGVHKSVSKIKLSLAPILGVKSVHVFWLYELLSHPQGLTAASLASKSKIDRSLISREVEELCARGYVKKVGGSGEKRKNYNSRIVLTEKGAELAEYIRREAMTVQARADEGISAEELELFYAVLEKLHNNFVAMTKEREEATAPQNEE